MTPQHQLQKVRGMARLWLSVLFVTASGLLLPHNVLAFSFVFAGETNGVDIVTHSQGYTGSGGVLNISVGIDSTSAMGTSMLISVANIVNTWNSLIPATNNLLLGGSNNVPSGYVDFESVALHELGHALGLGHPNAATESGLAGNDQNYTKTTDGADNVFNLNAGADGVIGTADDIRGDDINLNWYQNSNNNPFTIGTVVDSTTYSRDLTHLPSGDSFSANADRSVAASLGIPNTEAVMQQGTYSDEAQRTLGHDDVAGIRYAMSGRDELAGTADDYILNLTFAGLTIAADILLSFDNSKTGFAVTQTGGAYIGADHVAITSALMYFNTGYDWFFNDVSNSTPVPEPGTLLLLGTGLAALAGSRRLRKK